MTLTIDLTPAEEARLNATARQEGLDMPTLARKIVTEYSVPVEPAAPADVSEEDLWAEYRDLADLKLAGRMTEAQVARMREVEAALDDREEQGPAVQALYKRLDADDAKLDRILAILEGNRPTV